MLKKLLVVLGFFFLLLGIIGTLLPVIPTVPFLFVAYFCFNKGSERFRQWYLNSKFHKNYLKALKFYNSVPKIYKILYILGVFCFFIALLTLFYMFSDVILIYIEKFIGLSFKA